MKQQLWILNSSLLIIFATVLLINFLLKQKLPSLRIKPTAQQEIQKKKVSVVINLEKILKQDLFDTFIPSDQAIVQPDLTTPIPEINIPKFTPPPPIKKEVFIQPLNLSVKGIISSSIEEESAGMIADETNKEKVYHLGDKIKDGQVIRITRNNVVILRANGQQEVYLLRKEETLEKPLPEKEKWNYIIKKIDEKNFHIDPLQFSKEVPSLGEFIEDLSLCSAYEKGKIIGVRVGKIEVKGIGTMIGFNQNDIITSINNLNISNKKNRIKIYDIISESKIGDDVIIELKRKNQNLTLSYKLVKIEKPSKKILGKPPVETSLEVFKKSRDQQREQQLREFEKHHEVLKENKLIPNIRQRILENMKMRRQNRRIR